MARKVASHADDRRFSHIAFARPLRLYKRFTLTDEKNIFANSTAPSTTVTEERQTSFEGISPEEEKALRMLHGLTEPDDHELKFALGANEESRLKLAMMEKHLLDAFQWGELTTFEISDAHVDAKAKIIDKLRE
jgi:hypothetical protein